MDVDTVKTSASDSSNSMDMMAMMMQMEKFPEFYEPFYNTSSTTTYQENELISGGTSSTSISTTVPPIFAPPSLLDPPPSNVHINNNNNTTIHQQPMTTLPLPQTLNPSGRFRNNLPNASSFPYPSSSSEKRNSMAAMREMIFRIAVMQPIHIDPESIKPPKRRNVKISKDPQSVAARHRRERISERIRILQRLVPGGTKMDTASMLDEAIHYVKFLKKQVQTLEQAGGGVSRGTLSGGVVGFPSLGMSNANVSYSSLLMKGCQPNYHMVGSTSKQLFS